MTTRLSLLAMTPALLLLACGDLRTPGGKVNVAAYTSDGSVAAFLTRELVSLDGDLVTEQARIPYLGPPAGADVRAEALSADGHVAAIVWAPSRTTIPATIDLFTVPDRQLLASIADVMQPVSLHLDPTGALLAFISVQIGSVNLEVYDVASNTRLWSFDTTEGYDLAFSPDGAEVYGTAYLGTPRANGSIAYGHKLAAWNARTGEMRLMIDPATSSDVTPALFGVGVSPDGAQLISATLVYQGNEPEWAVTFRSTSDGALLQEVPFPGGDKVDLSDGAISADGHWAIQTVDPGAPDNSRRIVVGDAAGTILYTRPCKDYGTLAFSPDGARLLVTPPIEPGSPGLIVYDVASGTELATHAFGSDPL